MLTAAREHKKLKKFVFVTSSEIYGVFKPAGKILDESQPLNPNSPYAISKAAAEQVSLYYFHRFGLPVAIARSFNHSGPRQDENFVIPSFARQIAAIEAKRQSPVIKVGNLSARRDLSDVRDIVRGYRLLAERGRAGQCYQFCSGKTVSIQKVLDTMIGLSTRNIKVTIDKNRLRKNDIPILRGSNRKAVQELDFAIRYKLKRTLINTLDYWREQTPKLG